ncbi:hypothetical protein H6501_00875 [Candidatus Woesearchaeota archaeon]|nr:hypothetical protein [Nanoarchaeota archaeon]MCB9370130.1 hypothetical protein [Candidatus Woesearchaeota archaeon]USN44660.1 MAG: hypothetical protein H6500_02350 [Candidatus Woesearchaeota archaeon]
MKQEISTQRKAQITIFIIIALCIIVLLIFLFFLSSDEEKQEREQTLDTIIDKGNEQLTPLKSSIDSCLDLQLKRALLIAGMRGGFIYNRSEKYVPGHLPNNAYSETLLTNMQLNKNNLLSRTLLMSNKEVYAPLIDKQWPPIYNYSIKEEMEQFVVEEFKRCLKVKSFENEGFEVDFDQFSGEIFDIPDTQTLLVKDLLGEKGDLVQFTINDKSYTGTYEDFKLDEQGKIIAEIKNESGIFSDIRTEILNREIFAINLNTSLFVELDFDDESVTARLLFPASFNTNDTKRAYYSSRQTANIRFEKLLELASEMLSYKYEENKPIDYSDPRNLSKVIAEKNEYFRKQSDTGLSISMLRLVDDEDYKLYVYSLIDSKSKILGNPYVFNFAYENYAPYIDADLIPQAFRTGENSIVFVNPVCKEREEGCEEQTLTLDLKAVTKEAQFLDRWDKVFFVAQHYDGPDAYFSLTEDGQMTFVAYEERRFSFEVTVSDTETFRRMTFIFVAGLADNSGNQEAINCFNFINSNENKITPFPISSDLKNTLFSREGTDKEEVFGYTLGLDSSKSYSPEEIPDPFELYLDTSCLYDAENVQFTYEALMTDLGLGITQEVSFDPETGRIGENEIPSSLDLVSPLRFTVSISNTQTGTPLTDPYEVTIYPAACLGPQPLNANNVEEQEKIELYGGKLSCCNMEEIEETITNPQENPPQNFFYPQTNLASSSDTVLDTELYLCRESGVEAIFDPEIENIDPSKTNIFAQDPSTNTLYKVRIQSTCNGKYPQGDIHTAALSSSVVTQRTKHIESMLFNNNLISINKNLNIGVEKVASTCEFCYISEKGTPDGSMYVRFADGTVYSAGLVKANTGSLDSQNLIPKAGVTVLPDESNPLYQIPPDNDEQTWDSVFILCDESWYTGEKEDDTIIWQKGESGKGNSEPNTLYKSQGYCKQGALLESGKCDAREFSPSYDSRRERTEECKDWYINTLTGAFLSTQAPASWGC